MKRFIANIKHDNGITFLCVTARNEEQAVNMIMKAEGCPRYSIIEIKKGERKWTKKK